MPDKIRVKSWDVSALNRETNEWTKEQNHGYEYTPTADEIAELLVRRTPPKKVYPRRKPLEQLEGVAHVHFGDTHHPFTDKAKLALAMKALDICEVASFTFLGDDVDMAMFSTFERREEWAGSTQRGLDEFSEVLATARAKAPDAKGIAFRGNHELRLERELRKYNAELIGLRKANAQDTLGVLTMEYLLRCEELGIEYVSPYPEGEYWHTDKFKSYHGDKTGANVVGKELAASTVSFIHGHGHSNVYMERAFMDGRTPRTIFGIQLGAFASHDLVPSGRHSATERGQTVRQQQDWQPGVSITIEHEGELYPQILPITDRGIRIGDKIYKS